jgi:L-lactate dehydrogenase complex protein LldE
MEVALFIPCYINQFYPQVGIATLELLEKLGCRVQVPQGQTCCGQPMANAGFADLGEGCLEQLKQQFGAYDYVVTPSGSCAMHIKDHAPVFQGKVFELCELLTDVLQVQSLDASFPHRVGLHQSCHGLRGLGLARMSERMEAPFSKPAALLNMVRGLELAALRRPDECCGFGGAFSILEDAVSVKMGLDRLTDHHNSQVDVITGTDMSCLMHLDGLARREGSPIRVLHIAEILNDARSVR